MDIVEALNTLQPLVLREGDDCELDALASIRAVLAMPCCICDEATNAQAKVICECCVDHYYE
jgi:hypothetical protein